MALFRRFHAAAASAAVVSLLATPAAALELPVGGPEIYHEDSANNWGRRYHHRDRVDAGDVLAGVLILGGIAAIAGAASKKDRAERVPPPPPYPQDRQGYRSSYASDGRGLDSAVNMCVGQVERGPDRVDTVDGANRNGEGWTVSGKLAGGQDFTCRIDNEGRLRELDIGGWQGTDAIGPDRQYSDDVYQQARTAQDAAPAFAGTPGTALPGEEDDRPVWTGDDSGAETDTGG
ncbi:hypothetical protein GRI89_06890 [Altererythrobacter salegens]|uniref:Secreted protein n=1 Tax=Croceibacterium salegens TaxID=1737568 RepID=A0A6I4STE4_9SPHN|nr:hypothetical protein [Croceibacterium salegens]MXO59264.1 hypothetical protein [Croceibacterium salegens]